MYELENQDHTVVSTALKDNNNEEVSKDRWWAPIYLVICIIFSIFLGIAVVCAIVFIVLFIKSKGDREAQDNYLYALLFTCLLIVLFFAIAFMCFLFYDSPELDLLYRNNHLFA